ncbi:MULTISPECIES: group 1 truncated hemoglobin [Thermoactinomyces]|jgi:hemoglobin|uniref:Group 1 truncated hemoglobin n=1 Tax=Thermoactinomyces daqus TaxID=1329516 RepID=A0A7W1XAN2_9BACL|nr:MULTISPECIES: group 1 truncated hemoglobin [Thermoactinomyces]MBA4543198.1 group 1 truncated hemoglobin [Thermoactinomyces daqus]MBH8597218.1 group 1 truncated hemoglobin [Thermoactinomyces sp. CICC 10523]MBH8602778.1 group 1 truncated hemoglobin [Thermoactinomyces sp. CICC 10522]MBH8606113.1 group 1 truncated hemoglobin [Thermoactinomyces sp. CICC 10521]
MLKSTKSTLYERLGGEQTIAAVINEFYNRMIQDDRVNHHFIGVNMEALRRHQITYFMSFALGGPKRYEGSTLRQSHAGLNITSEEYEIAIKHLNSSLRKFNVQLEDIARVEAFLRSVKPHIIYK